MKNAISMTSCDNIRLIMMLSILIILTVFVEIYVSVILFSKTTVDYRSEIITKAAKLASEQIDADKIEGWLNNGADAEYQSTATTENAGMSIISRTTLKVPAEELYITVTGDQCAITGIKISD